MISLKEKLIMKALYHKFNNQLPLLATEIGYKRGKKCLFLVLYTLQSNIEKIVSYDLIKNGNEFVFTLDVGKDKHHLKFETKENYKSYYFVSINDELNIDEFVQIELI
ncbi:hypothetical protein [Petrotoga olearia]|uniref:Uncharacterized protein n=2 Tax=Petrotoga olearia TaxID=156203 RepID=A0A2K1P040_9BACT|nr:hypothetical protein [Petrotoga olearia]PNR96156.1 hypothetical protein X929_05720 [Petrotoga olearia DSM 13574]RMA71418.1 hypothetical protein C8D75_1514 [Petrotoga olearia]